MDNCHLQWIFPLTTMIFYSYVKLPDGTIWLFIYFYGPCSMAMLDNQRVTSSVKSQVTNRGYNLFRILARARQMKLDVDLLEYAFDGELEALAGIFEE